MNDMKKTKAQLIEELKDLRENNTRLSNLVTCNAGPDTALLRSLVDQMLEPTVILDWDGNVLHGNEMAAEVIGTDSAEVLTGMNLAGFIHPDSVAQAAEDLQSVKAAEADFSANYKLLVDGRTIHIESHGTKIELSDGSVDLVSFRDVTVRLEDQVQARTTELERLNRVLRKEMSERKATEDTLRESERKFRSLAESTTAHISIVQDDHYVYANQAMLDYFELDAEDLLLITPEDMMMGMLGPEMMKNAEIAWKSAMERGDTRFHFDIVDNDGTWFQTNATMMELEGKPSVMTMTFDITELKQAQKELFENEERYRTIFNTAGTGMLRFGEDKLVSMCNDEWTEMTGYSREEIVGKLTWMPFFTEESLAKMKRYHDIRSVDPGSVPKAYEAQVVDRRGKIHDGIVNIQMIPGTQQRVASFHDLTELKRAQQEMFRADKMAALGQIIAGVAHEINNPNNFIYFNLPILKKYIEAVVPMLEHHLEEDPDLKILNMSYQDFLDDVFKLLENMEHGSKRITGIVSELKTYVRSDDEVETTIEALAPVVDRVMALVGKQVRKTVKHFRVNVADNLPLIKMNPGKIEQVLINLVINAGQAVDKDDSWVNFSAQSSIVNNREWAEIIIEDNGVGIPEENIEQIFEPFFTSKADEQGTGLGLSISYSVIEEHGGTIEVASTLGKGTVFTIRLPAKKD